MNIINKVLLKAALLPSSLYNKMGIDTSKLAAIVTTKLILDDRRPNSFQQAGKKKGGTVSMATVGTMLVSAVMGLLYLLVFSIGSDIVTQLTLYLTLFLFLLSLTLISDFTSVLIDVRDNQIILPKPVNDRTVVMARLLHISIHLCKIVLPMSLAGLCYLAIEYGLLTAPLFLFLVLCVTTLSVCFVNALYLLILKVTTPQRFQSIISYVQVFFAVMLYGSYQLFPRMIADTDLTDFSLSTQKGIEAYPVYWLANTWQVLYSGNATIGQVIMAIAGLLLPVVCLFVVVRYLAPTFNQKLALLNNAVSDTSAKTTGKAAKDNNYIRLLSNVFTRGKTERAGFLFAWKMTARSRDFKLKVYPSMGYMLVYVVVLFFNSRNLSISDFQSESVKAKAMVLGALYFTSFLLMTAIGQIVYSDKYKAAWVYFAAPVALPGHIVSGAAKAALLKFYIPIVLFITIAGVTLVGPKVLPNILLGLLNEVFICAFLVYAAVKYLPFSIQQSTAQKTGSFLRGLFVFFLSGLIAFGHYLLYDFTPALLLCCLLSATASWVLFNSIKKMNWDALKVSYGSNSES